MPRVSSSQIHKYGSVRFAVAGIMAQKISSNTNSIYPRISNKIYYLSRGKLALLYVQAFVVASSLGLT